MEPIARRSVALEYVRFGKTTTSVALGALLALFATSAIGAVLDDDQTSCVAETFDTPPSPAWQHAFVGNATTGSFGAIGGRLRLAGNGTELYHGDDNGHFAWQEVAGDFRVEVDVAAIAQNTGGASRKACLMVRSSLNVRSPRVMACYQPQFSSTVTALQFDARLSEGAAAIELASTVQNVPLPVRFAFTRRDDKLTVSYSRDHGATWIEPKGGLGGTASLSSPVGETMMAGVMVASYQTPTLFAADYDNFRVCHPAPAAGGEAGEGPACEATRPLDVYYLVDLSDSMKWPMTGQAIPRLNGARAALDVIHRQLSLRDDGSRLGLATFAGKRNVPLAEQQFFTVLSPLTTDYEAVASALAGLDLADIDSLATTPTALAFGELTDLIGDQLDPAHLPVVLLFASGIPNVDLLGRGPAAYTFTELQAVQVRDTAGEFRDWPQVAWDGTFNSGLDTFDGEPVGNAMAAMEELARRYDDVTLYGLALGTFVQDLVDYAAWVTGGRSFPVADLTDADDATDAVLTELGCGVQGTATLGDLVWHDLDGDGEAEAGEPGIPGVTLELLSAEGGVVASAITAGDGSWELQGVLPGSYTVRVDTATLPGGLDQATYDDDGIASPDTAEASNLRPFRFYRGYDFGYRAAPPAVTCEVDDFAGPDLDGAWTLTAIGPATVGDAAVVDGRLQLTSNGPTLWDNDHCHFLHQPIEEDFRVEVEIPAFPLDPGGSTLRKAGLMVRKDHSVKSPRLMVQVLPDAQNGQGPTLQFGYRATQNGPALSLADVVFKATLPLELAIERRGGRYHAFYSTDDGVTWKTPTLGGAPSTGIDLDLGPSPLVGLAAASYQSSPLTVAADDFTVCRPAQP